MAMLLLAILLTLTITSLAAYRLYTILQPRSKPNKQSPPQRKRGERTHLLIVLGSGGHTAEMLSMLSRATSESTPSHRLNWSDYQFRTWVVGAGDSISAQRAKDFETSLAVKAKAETAGAVISTVPRARKIHQPILTTPFSSLRCLLACCVVLYQHSRTERGFPDLILCNGPATATILIFASLLLRFFDAGGCQREGKMRTVYVESWARVKRLSLSGRLLVWVVDRFLVQWPQLLEEGTGRAAGRGEYLGVLV